MKVYHLKANMRAIAGEEEFQDFLLRVGDGTYPFEQEDYIRLPDDMVIPWEAEDVSLARLVEWTYLTLDLSNQPAEYLIERAILSTKHEHVNKINDFILGQMNGEVMRYYSYDSVVDDTHGLYPQEFLNSLTIGGLPPHELKLKVGVPIMCLRNLDPTSGLCNGARLVCRSFHRNVIEAEIVTGDYKGRRVFIPRISLMPSADVRLPFQLKRKQFPIVLAFALTINKAQGQTIPHVGIYLPEPVFSHGQLYVALSRGRSKQTTKIVVGHSKLEGREGQGQYTKNVVYKEVLLGVDNTFRQLCSDDDN